MKRSAQKRLNQVYATRSTTAFRDVRRISSRSSRSVSALPRSSALSVFSTRSSLAATCSCNCRRARLRELFQGFGIHDDGVPFVTLRDDGQDR